MCCSIHHMPWLIIQLIQLKQQVQGWPGIAKVMILNFHEE